MDNCKICYNYLENGDPSVCEDVLRSLPDWFGIEESTVAYINKSKELPMITVSEDGKAIGFLSLLQHSPYTAEVYVMGIIPELHRKGVGKKLLIEAEKALAKNETEFLQVKTVSADRECEFYRKTRLFYKSFGFKEVEVFPTLWDEHNPCQLLIKSIPKEAADIEKVVIANYDKEWPSQFRLLKENLVSCLGELALSIDHIGSTSVPGLSAKDRIDIQITVKEISEDFKSKLDSALTSGGFQKSRDNVDHRPPGDESPDSHWKKLYISGVHPKLSFKANIHVRELGRENQKYPLLFRDFLREHPDSSGAYELLKKELSRFHPYDRIAYCEIKDPGCDLIMVHAREWAEKNSWTVEKSMEYLK